MILIYGRSLVFNTTRTLRFLNLEYRQWLITTLHAMVGELVACKLEWGYKHSFVFLSTEEISKSGTKIGVSILIKIQRNKSICSRYLHLERSKIETKRLSWETVKW